MPLLSMKPFPRSAYASLPLLLLFLGAMTGFSMAHPDHVDHTDEEINAMDIDSLIHVERDLRSQNGIVDKHITSLQRKLAYLKKQQDSLEKTEKNVENARNWESRQKRARQKELERAKAELEAKKERTRMLANEAGKLQEEILEMKETLQSLDVDRTRLDEQYKHPSLDEILVHKAAHMGSVPQHIVDKTLKHIVPEVKYGLKEAFAAHENFGNDSTVTNVLKSLCIYILALSILYITYTFVRNMSSLLTLTRTLFTVDMAFAFIWLVSCFFYILLSEDPFGIMAKRHEGLTVIFQVVLITALVGNVILRCIPPSLEFKKMAVLELLCTIFVGQHFYQSVWRPSLIDEDLRTSFRTYVMYFLISAGLAVYRARSVGREMEGPKGTSKRGSLSFLQDRAWLRMKMERTLKFCEDLLSGPSKQENVYVSAGPQYYRTTRRPEFSRGKGRSIRGKQIWYNQ